MGSFNIDSRNFVSFCLPPNIQLEDKAGLNEWLERMMFLFEDLKWLLSQKCEMFWKQITYDNSWIECFESFLQNAPRSFDLKNIPDGCKTAMSRICRLFLLITKRMSMPDEDNMFSSREDYGEFIYQNYHFDAAKLLDICGIFYRPDCGIEKHLKDIFGNIFNCQPSYYGDFSNVLITITSTIENMEARLQIKSHSKSKEFSKNPIQEREAQDMITFLYDMTKTFESLIKVHPAISFVFFKASFIGRLANLCENMLGELIKIVSTNKKKFIYMKKEIETGLLWFVNDIITIGFVDRVQQNREVADPQEMTMEYVAIMGELSQFQSFLIKYCEMGAVYQQMETIALWEGVDISSLEYVKDMIPISSNDNKSVEKSILPSLKEFLPNKSESFFNACIEKYGANVDVIVNNVIENNIVNESQLQVETKKPITVPNKDILEDNKEHVKLLKKTFLDTDIRNNAESSTYDMYEDEYDDTYDSQNIAAQDGDSADELNDITSRRKFTIPNILRQMGDETSSDSESDADEEKDDENKEQHNTDGFANDNRRNDNRPDRNGNNRRGNIRGGGNRGGGNNRGRGNRGGGGGRGRGGSNRGGRGRDNRNNNDNNADNHDFAVNGEQRGRGGGRGRGRSRNYRGDNHNRRVLAAKKRARSMMPS